VDLEETGDGMSFLFTLLTESNPNVGKESVIA
jgi:hypothetical protein